MKEVEGKRECEVKYKLQNLLEESYFIEKIERLGFKFKSNNLESDYTPDVEGFLCKKNGLMLRFRVLEGTDNDVLLTLKIKIKGNGFQDNYEIETLFSNFDEVKFQKINEKLYNAIKCKLSPDVKNLKDIDSIRKYLKENSFTEHRIFTQKKRKEYIDSNQRKITIDEFPKNIGKYLEIETESPEQLFKIVQSLGLKKEQIEKKNYGEIIKEKQNALPEEQRRTCIFIDENEKKKKDTSRDTCF